MFTVEFNDKTQVPIIRQNLLAPLRQISFCIFNITLVPQLQDIDNSLFDPTQPYIIKIALMAELATRHIRGFSAHPRNHIRTESDYEKQNYKTHHQHIHSSSSTKYKRTATFEDTTSSYLNRPNIVPTKLGNQHISAWETNAVFDDEFSVVVPKSTFNKSDGVPFFKRLHPAKNKYYKQTTTSDFKKKIRQLKKEIEYLESSEEEEQKENNDDESRIFREITQQKVSHMKHKFPTEQELLLQTNNELDQSTQNILGPVGSNIPHSTLHNLRSMISKTSYVTVGNDRITPSRRRVLLRKPEEQQKASLSIISRPSSKQTNHHHSQAACQPTPIHKGRNIPVAFRQSLMSRRQNSLQEIVSTPTTNQKLQLFCSPMGMMFVKKYQQMAKGNQKKQQQWGSLSPTQATLSKFDHILKMRYPQNFQK